MPNREEILRWAQDDCDRQNQSTDLYKAKGRAPAKALQTTKDTSKSKKPTELARGKGT